MQKLSKIGRIFSLVFLAGTLWLVYLILVFSFEENTNKNTQYIPENATSVYRLDGRVLTRELLASLLISEDDDLRKMAQSKIPTTKEGKLKPVGISFDSDIILFRLEDGKSRFTGMLFNLWDDRTFKRNIPKLVGDNGAIASTENVGLLLLQLEGDMTQKQLSEKAAKMLSKETSFLKNHPAPENKSLISVWYQEGNSSISDVGISVQDNQLIISGAFETSTDLNAKNLAQYTGGFHIHTQWFPEIWSSLLQDALKERGIEIPSIRQLSINYFGTTIVTEPSVMPLPILTASIEFKDVVSVDSLFGSFPLISNDTISGMRIYDVLTKKYEITQIDSHTISIASTDGLKLTKKSVGSIAEISGSPDYLLNIDGDKFISRVLVLSNEYRAVSSLINEITSIDIKMTPSKNNTYRIRGTIALNDDKWPLNELLKFLIRSKLLQ